MEVTAMRKFLGILFVVLLAASACGGDGGGNGTRTDATETGAATQTEEPGAATRTEAAKEGATAAPVELEGEVNNHGSAQLTGTSLEMEADDFYFEPTFVQAASGTTVEVTVTNEGNAAHTFTIDDQNVDVELDAGQSETVEVTVEDGTVNYYCRFHVGQGMQGAFYTEAGAAGPAGGAGTKTGGGAAGY